MLFYTHIAFSILLGIISIDFLDIKDRFIFFFFLILFSLLPDIDKADSKAGRKTGKLSKIINFLIGHRGFFHSLLFLIAGHILLSIFSETIASAFILALASHMILDAITPLGITPFYPLRFRVSSKIKTGSILEKIIFLSILFMILLNLTSGLSQFL